MAHTARLLLTVAFLGGILALPETHAQAPAPAPRTASEAPTPATRPDVAQLVGDLPAPLPGSAVLAPETGWEPEFLRSLPRPPDQPGSLLQPAPPATPPANLERYFVQDPVLDPPQWPKTGWFTDVQIDIIHPHFFANKLAASNANSSGHGVTTSNGRTVNVVLGSARLNWTVAPRLELGYRLPSGFGEFSVSDRGFYTDGTGPFNGPAGNFTRTSHLGMNYTDADYASREYTQWVNWTLKWRVGVRTAFTWFDTTVSEPFNVAAAGNGVFAARTVNYTVGAGPHFGVALDHNFAQPGLSFLTKIDFADTFARVRQRFSVATTSLTPAGQPSKGELLDRFWNEVPILNFQVGLGWQPPRYPNVHLYMGYVYEFWWQVATNSNLEGTANSKFGFFDNQGVVLQAAVDF
jgi:hypothetical protein